MKGQRMAITLPPQQASLLRKIAVANEISISKIISILVNNLIIDVLKMENEGKEEVQ